MVPQPSTLIVIPTYNEAENVVAAVTAVLKAMPTAHVLIADDGSPDGTGALADSLAGRDERVFVLHRTEKAGLGAAYLAGFGWALNRGYGEIGEFDADGSHPATALPDMARALRRDDSVGLVIGSRWVAGGSVVNWPKSRELLSRGGNMYARMMLRMPVRDATGGFRLYEAETLRTLDLAGVASKGYCFQVDLALRVLDAGRHVAEVPIQFRDRTLGESKMSRAIVLEAMGSVTVWGLRRALTQLFARPRRRKTLRPANT